MSTSITLPDEIWGRILSFLQREQAWVSDIRKGTFHQHDLSVAMRVNTVSRLGRL
jgi:hypothetical protein